MGPPHLNGAISGRKKVAHADEGADEKATMTDASLHEATFYPPFPALPPLSCVPT
jgi:hypothetical protein